MFKRVACGISGGVDSAVCASLLKRRGFDVIGVFMRSWDPIEETGTDCPQNSDMEDAKSVCDALRIPFTQVDLVREYWHSVFEQFLESYRNGRTPNPDVLCNRYIKFDHLFKHVTGVLHADALATGHYARSSFGDYLEKYQEGESAKLLRPSDKLKDQTLFLSGIRQEALRLTMFPLSSYLKPDVKRMAVDTGFGHLSEKKESIGMCFIGKRDFQRFIDQYLPSAPGDLMDIDTGDVVGMHNGVHHYTCGQNVAIEGSLCKYYVTKCDVKSNRVYVCNDTYHRSLYCTQLWTLPPSWIEETEPKELSGENSMKCRFIFQRFALPFPCIITKLESGGLKIDSRYPARSPALGQFAVLYKNDECLGSAEISQKGPPL